MDITIVKIGGAVIENPDDLAQFLAAFEEIKGAKILIHGGGKDVSKISSALGLQTKMVDGRRITDAETLKLATMVYAGFINKNIVAKLGVNGKALGLSGADLNIVQTKKRPSEPIDFGFVGDPFTELVNTTELVALLDNKVTPVFCAITHDGQGQLLNTNADSVASIIAQAIAIAGHTVHLNYCFEKTGVLTDIENDDSYIKSLPVADIEKLHQSGIIHTGMLPKLDNAKYALANGVNSVYIKHWKNVAQNMGTQIC